MKTSLIIVTYNWKEALELSLKSVLNQSVLPDEIIVADDGSSDGTGKLIREYQTGSPIPINYIWHEDEGFRAARCRNMAIAGATGEYIILIDGDIVLDRYFVEDHLKKARPGFFIQGSRVLLSRKATEKMLQGDENGITNFDVSMGNRKNGIRSLLLSRLFSSQRSDLNGIRTCNFAFFRKDALAVNGFNEDFIGWGREDSEFAARLLNNGVHRMNLRFAAIAYHLFHAMKARNNLPRNDAILTDTIKRKDKWCKNGLQNHLA